MRQLIYYLTILSFCAITTGLYAQEQVNKVTSQGGGVSTGGTYSLFSVVGGEVVESAISGGTYTGRVGFIFSTGSLASSLLQDSLALVAIFNSTGGTGWTSGNDSWLKENLSSGWFGITVSNNRVTGISLPGNNLQESIPQDINSMDSLSVIELQNNKITSIPDMRGLSKISILDVSGNSLEFSSLEANATITGINYQNQALIGKNEYIVLPVGSDTTLSIKTSGTANSYQWYLKDAAVSGATKDTLGIVGLNRSKMGDYHVKVTNTKVPGLTLTSNLQVLIAIADMNGQITLSDGTPLPDGEVKLLKINGTDGFDTTNVSVVDANGFYQLDSIVLGDYLMVALADTVKYPDQFPTYYTRSIFWEEADTLLIGDNLSSINLQLEAIPEVTLTGTGSIAGVLEEEVPEGGRVEARKRVAGAGVSVRRAKRSGKEQFPRSRMMQEYELVAFIYTNKNGEFTFKDLEEDTYRINVQYPGYPMDETSEIDLVIGTKTNNKDLDVKAVVQNGKIAVTATRIVGIDEDIAKQLSVYPNPTDDYLNVSFGNLESQSLSIRLFDNKGVEVRISTVMDSNKATLNLQSLNHGIYILNIYDEKKNEIIGAFKVAVSR